MISIALILLIINSLLKDRRKLISGNIMENFAFLIPARDEAKVIENLLISILNQTEEVNPKDIYVIVEDINDPTVKICENYNVTFIVRQNLHLRTKGYALDEGIKQIKKHYDAYFIVDADNVLDKDFVKELKKSYQEGYDIATGYRNAKNGNDSLIAASSTLTFSLMNTVLNMVKSKNGKNVILSGTGFYIKGDIIEKFNGYPFCSLTEDYELTLYSILNNLNTYYNEKAIFYDEQPIKYKNTINQRVRWIKGYFLNRRKYIPLIRKKLDKNKASKIDALIGINPYLLMIIELVLFIIYLISKKNFLFIFLLLLIIYFILMLVTIFVLINDKKLNLNKKMKIKTIFFNPIYMISYVHVALIALFKKDVKWDKVDHFRNINL